MGLTTCLLSSRRDATAHSLNTLENPSTPPPQKKLQLPVRCLVFSANLTRRFKLGSSALDVRVSKAHHLHYKRLHNISITFCFDTFLVLEVWTQSLMKILWARYHSSTLQDNLIFQDSSRTTFCTFWGLLKSKNSLLISFKCADRCMLELPWYFGEPFTPTASAHAMSG